MVSVIIRVVRPVRTRVEAWFHTREFKSIREEALSEDVYDAELFVLAWVHVLFGRES